MARFSSVAERLDAVVEVVDQDAAVVVLHGGQQARQHHRGIRRPVAVVAAVQFVTGAVERDVDARDAARAEDDLLAAALVDGPVADQPDVARQQVLVLLEDVREVRRAGLFLAFEDEFEVGVTGYGGALRASSAVAMAMIGALSSEAERA